MCYVYIYMYTYIHTYTHMDVRAGRLITAAEHYSN